MTSTHIEISSRFDTTASRQVQHALPSCPAHPKSIIDVAETHATRHKAVEAGAELFAEGGTSDCIYVVLEGWLFLHRILEDGRRQILDFALPGSVLSYGIQPGSTFAFSAEAITNTVIAVIPLRQVNSLLRSNPESAAMILNAANESLLSAFDTMTDIGRRTAREAVAHFLLRMHQRVVETIGSEDDGTISLPLHQEHIGDALGLTAVHVCRTLRKLRNDGLVEVSRGHLHIPDPEGLAMDAGIFGYEQPEFRIAS